MLEKLRPLLAAEVRRHHWEITCSVGVVTAPAPAPDVEPLLRSADQLMYRINRATKDAVLFALLPPA